MVLHLMISSVLYLHILTHNNLNRAFFDWLSSLTEVISGFVAIDGKTMRRSHDKKKGLKPLHMVSAWASDNRLILCPTSY